MTQKIKPVGVMVLIRPSELEKKTSSGLWVPEKAQKRPPSGEVLSVGKGVKQLKSGCKVLYKKNTGHIIEQEGEELLLISENDIEGWY